ncbi:cell division control protein 6 homolog [Lethenteron reissneri]|uniref:cell division control protein 6 homolog n=1 Tax=Lethenteron reissneri TaxID=7753 RepID=UPI002AB7100F|nr:cell division control protein 6 homolog [Lethenteron reissneri]
MSGDARKALDVLQVTAPKFMHVESGGAVIILATPRTCRTVWFSSDCPPLLLERRAVEKLGGEIRKQTVLSPNGEGPALTTTVPRRVTLPQISAVLSEVYGSPMASRAGDHGGSFPLQQKLLVITLLMLVRSGKVREFTFGKIHETYTGVCQRHQMARLHQSECLALCSLLEARGILTIKNSKEARLMKVSLKIDQSDVEHALQDKVLLSSILQAGIPK